MRAELKKLILKYQQNEVTEYKIYTLLALRSKGRNRSTLNQIAQDELAHSIKWQKYTGVELTPSRLRVFYFVTIARLFSLTFAVKMMENGENGADKNYRKLVGLVPEAAAIVKDENRHEKMLIEILEEEKLEHLGSMVLGISDALVELTGTLAGLTLAFGNTRLVGIAGLITGIAASLSMGASEYLSQKSEAGAKSPLKASLYTTTMYLTTVAVLVSPFFIFENRFKAISVTLASVIFVVAAFSIFVSVVKESSFKKMFFEMAGICLGVAGISFLIGMAVNKYLHIPI